MTDDTEVRKRERTAEKSFCLYEQVVPVGPAQIENVKPRETGGGNLQTLQRKSWPGVAAEKVQSSGVSQTQDLLIRKLIRFCAVLDRLI